MKRKTKRRVKELLTVTAGVGTIAGMFTALFLLAFYVVV